MNRSYLWRQGVRHAMDLVDHLDGDALTAECVKLLDGMDKRQDPPEFSRGMRDALEYLKGE